MTTPTWNRLGPREKQILALLRRSDSTLTARDVLEQLDDTGVSIAYTTVSTILERLTEKGLLKREEETYAGSYRFRYRFESSTHRRRLVKEIIDDTAAVLGDPGLELLAREADRKRTTYAE